MVPAVQQRALASRRSTRRAKPGRHSQPLAGISQHQRLAAGPKGRFRLCIRPTPGGTTANSRKEPMKLPKLSMGIGDRFAHQGKAQLAAFVKANQLGVDVAPVWNK